MSDLLRKKRESAVEDRNERARAAVKAFRAMQHGLTGYARAITGNPKVRVEVSTGPPRTDGSIIYYQPPMRLGDKTPHTRERCDKRNDETGLQTCAACAIREEVLVNIYHEIAHIVFGTFAPTSDKDRKSALARGVEEWGTSFSNDVAQRINNAPYHMKESYPGLATLISPFLPSLLNSLEDARVDTAMFDARKGVKKMLMADTYSLMRDGVEVSSGKISSWLDAELNSQASIACYLSAAGYEGWGDYLHEKVYADIESPGVQAALDYVRRAGSASEVYEASFGVLVELRNLGYMHLPEEQSEEPQPEPDPEPDPEPEQEEQEDEQEEPGDSGEGDPDQEGDGSDADDPAQDERGEGDAPGKSEQGGTSEESGDVSDGAPDDTASEDDLGDGAGSGGAEEADNSGDRDDSPSGDGDSCDPCGESGSAGDDDDGDEPASESGAGTGTSPDPTAEPESDVQESDADSDPARPDESPGAGERPGSGEQDEQEADDLADGDAPADGVDHQDSDATGDDGAGEVSGGTSGSKPEAGSGEHEPASSEEAPVDPESGDDPEGSGEEADDSVLESGADEGNGGIPVPEWGSPQDVELAVESLHEAHEDVAAKPEAQLSVDDKAIILAVIQGMYFETPSAHVATVEEYRSHGPAWDMKQSLNVADQIKVGLEVDCAVPENILGPSLMKLRRMFDDNKISKQERHRRTGKIDAKVLGRRAWSGDDRLFSKKRIPGKKDYSVLIIIDISSSNLGDNLALVKRAAFAQAELMSRLGVEFAVIAHQASVFGRLQERVFGMGVYHIKDWKSPWNEEAKDRLRDIGAIGGNLDGHALEFARKMLDKCDTTDRVILYFTDGKMPAANHDEELEILQREIRTCKRKGYTLMGVGIRTDSPVRHGLDTIQVDDDEDLKRVVEHLGRRLANPGR